MRASVQKVLITWLLLIGLALVVYAPALNGQFLWDDDAHVTRPELRSLDGLRRIWVEPGATQQVLPPPPQRVLARAPALGRRGARLSRRQRVPARDVRDAALADSREPWCRGRLACRGRLRRAPPPGGISRVDLGVEEYALADLPPGVAVRVPGLRSRSTQVPVLACTRALRAWSADQDRRCDPARRDPRDPLVAARSIVLAPGCRAAGSLVRRGCRRGPCDRRYRALDARRRGSGVQLDTG